MRKERIKELGERRGKDKRNRIGKEERERRKKFIGGKGLEVFAKIAGFTW